GEGEGEADAGEPVLSVDREMVLVAEGRHEDLAGGDPLRSSLRRRRTLAAALQRPATVAVDLAGRGRLPVPGRSAALHDSLLRLVQPRPAGFDDGRIDDL